MTSRGAVRGAVSFGLLFWASSGCSAPSAPRTIEDGIPPGTKTMCVKGEPFAFGSSQESGGIAPDIPDVVTTAPAPVPPLSGGTLLPLADGSAVAVSDPERDRVYLVGAEPFGLRATVALDAGDEPGRIVEDARGSLHVVLRGGGAIATLDPRTGTLTDRRPTCSAPRGVAYEPGLDRVHVACAGGEILSLPAAGGAPLRTLMLERDLRDVVVGPGGTLLVSTFRRAEAIVLSAAGRETGRLRPGSGSVPAVTGGAERRSPSVAWRTVPFDPASGSVVMLHQTGRSDLVDTAPGGYAAKDGCGGIVHTALSLLTPGRPSPGVATGLDGLTLTIDVAVSPDHQKVALAVAGNNPAQGPTLVQLPSAAASPGAPVACQPVVTEIEAPPSGQVVAVGYGPSGVLFAQTREPATLWRADTSATTVLASDARADTGHLLFHANSGGGLACASCHPEGGEDGRVWDLVCVGGRRTQTLRGGLHGTEPFHWDGREEDFSYLTDDVFSGRMVGPPLSDDQKKALLGWIETLPALPAPGNLDPLAVARGRSLFDDATVGCSACHDGPRLTNNATVAVGTGRPYQVPSLAGIGWRPPYMHDGCAPTLADRFGSASCGGGDQHGVTSHLTRAQLADLTAYLTSL
jgi:hypothetical protein